MTLNAAVPPVRVTVKIASCVPALPSVMETSLIATEPATGFVPSVRWAHADHPHGRRPAPGQRLVDALKEIGVGMLGYAFMGKAHVNAYRTLPYMLDPAPALPRLAAIAGRDERALSAAAARYGFATHYTDWLS